MPKHRVTILLVFGVVLSSIALTTTELRGQGLVVGNGAVVNLGDSTLNLNCNDVTIEGGGTLNGDGVTWETSRHITIHPAGVFNGGAASIQLCGTWTNDGTFNQDAATVAFYTGCGVTNDVRGDGDSDGDGIPDDDDPQPFAPRAINVPTLAGSGMAILAGLVALLGLFFLRGRVRS